MAPGSVASMVALLLLAAGCATSQITLSDAIEAGDLSQVNRLIDEDVDVEGPLVLGMTPLMRAANRNSIAIATALTEAGADTDAAGSGGLTPLHVAARADAAETLSYLLAAGADPELRSASGMNALDHASASGAVKVLEDLSSTGVDLNAPSRAVTQGHGYPRDQGPTPLGLAVREGHIDSARALLDLGADVDGLSASEHTPLLLAIFFDQSPEMVRILLDAGADPTAEAACDLGCSVAGGRPLSAREWASELGRDRLLADLP